MADHAHISKTLSYWLRHRPDDASLDLNPQGWASLDAVLAALAGKNLPNDIETLLLVVERNDKQRFELAPDLSRIRARQGHSIAVDLALEPREPPPLLYHGTADRLLDAIMVEGLRKMARHHVHLSPDQETARRVGARRGRPVILRVDAAAMARDGHVFYATENMIWLTDAVPPRFLRAL